MLANLGRKRERKILTHDQIHKFVRLEKTQNTSTANFVEALIEGVKMLRNRFVKNVIYVKVDVLLPRNG